EVTRTGADLEIEARHRLEVVVVDVGARRDHGFDGAVLAQEVGGEHLDGGGGRGRADGADRGGEVARAAVVEVVAVDRGDDHVGESQLGHGGGDVAGLGRVERAGQS